jgi:hypothetical protein
VKDLGQESIAVAKVMLDQSETYAGLLRDIGHPRGVDAPFADHHACCFQDQFPAVGFLGYRHANSLGHRSRCAETELFETKVYKSEVTTISYYCMLGYAS